MYAGVLLVATPLNADVFDQVAPFEQRTLEDGPVRHLVPPRHHNIIDFLESDVGAPRILRVEGFVVASPHECHRHGKGQRLPRGRFRDDDLTGALVYMLPVGLQDPLLHINGRWHCARVGGNPLRHFRYEDSGSPPVDVVEPGALRGHPWGKVAQNGDHAGAVGVLEAVGVHAILRCGSWYTVRQRVGPPSVALLDHPFMYSAIIEAPI